MATETAYLGGRGRHWLHTLCRLPFIALLVMAVVLALPGLGHSALQAVEGHALSSATLTVTPTGTSGSEPDSVLPGSTGADTLLEDAPVPLSEVHCTLAGCGAFAAILAEASVAMPAVAEPYVIAVTRLKGRTAQPGAEPPRSAV